MENQNEFKAFTFDRYLNEEEAKYPGTIKKLEALAGVKITQARFIKKLVEFRKQKRITQREIERLTGIKQSEISRFENGNYQGVTFTTVLKYMAALDVDLPKVIQNDAIFLN